MTNKNIIPIAMKCSQEQFDQIKDKLADLEFQRIGNFTIEPYLVNNFCGDAGIISNIAKAKKIDFNRIVYEEWDENIFLEACGIKPEFELPKKWYMLLDSLTYEDLVICDGWRKSVCETYSAYDLTYGDILTNSHPDRSYFYTHSIRNLKSENWAKDIKEITFDQFKKYILKQEQTTTKNKEVMSTQKLNIPVSDVLQIHTIACDSWKERIAKYLTRIDSNQMVKFSQSEVDDMFKAATGTQMTVLEKIFGKKELTIEEMAKKYDLDIFGASDVGNNSMIEIRTCGNLQDKVFFLNSSFDWEIVKDELNVVCLVPKIRA